MKIKLLSLLILTISIATSPLTKADESDSKQQVLDSVHAMWSHAEGADLQSMFATAPKEHTYVMAGIPLWDRNQTLALYQAAFDGVARQEITTVKEQVSMLDDNIALYMADMSYTQYDDKGQQLESGPYTISVVLKKQNGQWLNMHTHQSFPAAQ